jgi:TolB-like protein
MRFEFLRKLGIAILPIFLVFFFTSCSYKDTLNGSNDFHSLISKLVDDSATKIKKNVSPNEVVLVSDFVNLDKLKNKSQLGFLLSSMLKDRLVSLNIIVKEVEFGKEFEFGKTGLNVLTRDKDKILSDKIKSRYAVVGTYSLTNKSLNLFVQLIDINTGNILSSSYEKTQIDEEILELEGNNSTNDKKAQPATRPFLVL